MNTKIIIKNILEWLIYILIFLAIVYGTPKLLVKILHTDYPIASITSSSMWPALKEGDIVFVKGVSEQTEVKVGDVVVYKNDPSVNSGRAGFTIHRIIEMGENTLTTKGDANNIADTPINYDELIGKTVNLKDKPFRIPYLGKLSQIFNKRN